MSKFKQDDKATGKFGVSITIKDIIAHNGVEYYLYSTKGGELQLDTVFYGDQTWTIAYKPGDILKSDKDVWLLVMDNGKALHFCSEALGMERGHDNLRYYLNNSMEYGTFKLDGHVPCEFTLSQS